MVELQRQTHNLRGQERDYGASPAGIELEIDIIAARTKTSQFAYSTGQSVQAIFATPGRDGIAIRVGDLGVGGTLEVYCKKVRGVTREGKVLREGAEYQYDPPSEKAVDSFCWLDQPALIKGATSLFDWAWRLRRIVLTAE